ncbi:hypothetical protein AVEN_105842-1 [Araneus ventricosus]|uniref:Transposase Tc1-like domain-containing protein n=1 Tax=Araneus ventricosus TaxID=182803 RepID=A0A4Y2TDD5_ARAVE|nr:hypothetical protein AVEN_105842-1 [Araneus ventricosus]
MITRRACSKKQTSTEIKRELSLRCSVRTVRRVLQKERKVRYGKLMSRPPLIDVHGRLRVEFAKKCITMGMMLSFPMRKSLIWIDQIFFDTSGMISVKKKKFSQSVDLEMGQ